MDNPISRFFASPESARKFSKLETHEVFSHLYDSLEDDEYEPGECLSRIRDLMRESPRFVVYPKDMKHFLQSGQHEPIKWIFESCGFARRNVFINPKLVFDILPVDAELYAHAIRHLGYTRRHVVEAFPFMIRRAFPDEKKLPVLRHVFLTYRVTPECLFACSERVCDNFQKAGKDYTDVVSFSAKILAR